MDEPVNANSYQILVVDVNHYNKEAVLMNDDENKTKEQLIKELTELQQINEDLQIDIQKCMQTQEEYQDLLNNANEIMFIHDLEGNFIFTNKAGEQILGYLPGQFKITSFFDILPQEYHQNARDMIRKKINEHITTTYEVQVMAKDGNLVDLELSTRLIYKDSRPYAVQGIAQDITERRFMKKTIQESEDKFSTVFRCNPDPISITNLEGYFIEVNDAYLKITNYEKHEVVGHTINELGIYAFPEKRDLIIKQLQEQGSIRDFEIEFRIKSGEIRIFLLSAETIDINGKQYILNISKDITDRKQAEIRLQEERNLNAALLDTAGDLIVVCDQDGRIVRFNQICEQITGYTFDDMKEQYIWEAVTAPEDVEYTKSLFSLEKGANWDSPGLKLKFTNHWVTINGKYRLINWTLTFLVNEKGSTTYVIGSGTDITQQRIMEDRLRNSEAELRIIMENVNGVIYALSSEGYFTFVSPGCMDIIGHKVVEVEGHSFESFVHPEDLYTCRSFLKKVNFKGEAQKGLEIRIKHRDGSWRWHTTSIAAVKDKNGNPTYYVGISVDITDRKQAEEAFRESEQRFREMLENVKLVAVILDNQGRLTFCNDFLLKLSGGKREEVINRDWGETFVPQDIRERDMRIIKTSLERRVAPSYGESEIQTKSGEHRTILWNNTLIINPDGSAGFASIAEDITERRIAEKRSQELLLELQSVNQELKDFANIVSHDLKAPLRGIKSLAEWLYNDYQDKFDQEGKEQLDMLINRVNRMNKLIEGILRYSRVTSKNEERTVININEAVKEVIEMLLPPDNISIIIENELPSLTLERNRTQQLFANLINNAINYMDKPKGEIHISCQKQGEFWRFSIQDNGCGIEEKNFDNIFTIFQTLKPRDEFESTGIGLTIVKKIVEIYGGKVWVESKVGEGSTFHFTLKTSLSTSRFPV
ncbi:MAG: hypothetical protein CVU90_04075 [Firmicutes bacterium HGW-Firmicutes-15]|nr:MAG: hypothetical protein CVU90_04075 [Firmicutes bacterium HGW-Firmicutes-15]